MLRGLTREMLSIMSWALAALVTLFLLIRTSKATFAA